MNDMKKITDLVGELIDIIYDSRAETARELGNLLLPVIQKILAELGLTQET